MEHENFSIEIEGEEIEDLYPDLIGLEVELDDELAGMFWNWTTNWQVCSECESPSCNNPMGYGPIWMMRDTGCGNK
ncbi:MAG: hypothetical protein ACYSWO_06855 [Planctomycetota bacterium]|jgi:hypothetical protein